MLETPGRHLGLPKSSDIVPLPLYDFVNVGDAGLPSLFYKKIFWPSPFTSVLLCPCLGRLPPSFFCKNLLTWSLYLCLTSLISPPSWFAKIFWHGPFTSVQLRQCWRHRATIFVYKVGAAGPPTWFAKIFWHSPFISVLLLQSWRSRAAIFVL